LHAAQADILGIIVDAGVYTMNDVCGVKGALRSNGRERDSHKEAKRRLEQKETKEAKVMF
jgi:hypothetical protein